MKQITEYLSTKVVQSKIKATNETIKQIVKSELDRLGHDADLNHIDVSEVTNMKSLFSCVTGNLGEKYKDLNPDISQWNTSNVENMRYMFYDCEKFNQDLSRWDVSKVIYMQFMFCYCKNFNQDISGWNVSNVKTMNSMFYACEKFNRDISGWDVKNVKYKDFMFYGCGIKEEYKPKFKYI